ncbi:1-acyl-sn-glycerol-3-phosphate acyltransferase [Pelosinus propionicus DSM 13327]|uniref:1-acyl-sn-glycerol-3-phosphate acyltransferase n=1 Tax=Pelosinus propionicus DSM 13327 TaxID=1123291 RepID=A0A1I4H8K0_9FIRM|nr:1-acyl-sn-glycerol-3-phosphate acyltransferase [Pelosinus propionicus DSM 13327]
MYSVIRVFLHYFFKIFFRCRIIGIENIPVTGGAIIASNHVSLFDPPVVGTAFTRSIHFMAKEELFAVPFIGWFLKKLNAFPVRRATADRTAIRHAINLLENGELLGLFPEGTRSLTGKLGKPETGLAMIALKAGVPIIPTAVIGTNKVWKEGQLFPRFIVKFGNPIIVNQEKADKETMENLSTKIMQEISLLLEEKVNF